MSHSHKILVCDLFPSPGHRYLNEETVKAIRDNDVALCTEKGYFKDEFIDQDVGTFFYPVVKTRVQLFKCLWYTIFLIRLLYKNEFSKVLILTYEIRSFALVRLLASKFLGKIYIMQHYNIDAVDSNSINRFCFNTYCKRVNHIVFQQYIKEHLVSDYCIPAISVNWINHPGINFNDYPISSKKEIVALSASNSVEKLNTLISYENEHKLLLRNGYIVHAKKRTGIIGDVEESVHLESSYIPYADFNEMMKNAQWVLILYPDDYVYRESGLLLEALSNSTRVIGYCSCKVVNEYSKKYPHLCYAAKDVEELVTIILNNDYISPEINNEFDRFKEEHSLKKYAQSIVDLIVES